MGDVADLKLTGPVRAVLRVLGASRGRRLHIAQICTDARVPAPAVRVALAELGKARLVQHMLVPGFDRTPARNVYWLTGDGYAAAAAQRAD